LKIAVAVPGIELDMFGLVIRSSDHSTTQLL
jgi:hypothetical protein